MRLRLALALATLSALALSCAAMRRNAGGAAPPTLEEQQPRLAFRPPVDLAAVPDSFWINGSVTVQVKLARDGHVRMARVYSGYIEMKDPRPAWADVVDSVVVDAARRAIFVMPKNAVDLEPWTPFEYALPADAVGWPHDRLVIWTGKVVDAATGAPLGGVVVRVAGERLGAWTDPAGIARVPSLRAGRFAIVAYAPYYTTYTDSVTVTPGHSDTTLIRLARWNGPMIVDTLWLDRRIR